jgi:hypothetical protein
MTPVVLSSSHRVASDTSLKKITKISCLRVTFGCFHHAYARPAYPMDPARRVICAGTVNDVREAVQSGEQSRVGHKR